MEVNPTPGQQAFIQQAIESGRLDRPEAAVEEALSLWEELQRRRAELLADIEEARVSLAQGEGLVIAGEKNPANWPTTSNNAAAPVLAPLSANAGVSDVQASQSRAGRHLALYRARQWQH